jgi:hypothetical protein
MKMRIRGKLYWTTENKSIQLKLVDWVIMSARNGDKSRHGRLRKAKLARRITLRTLKAEVAKTAATATQAK